MIKKITCGICVASGVLLLASAVLIEPANIYQQQYQMIEAIGGFLLIQMWAAS